MVACAPVRGHFISFEGVDGSGKSTQLIRLAERLRSAGRDVVTTREPGGTPLGDRIRQLVLESGEQAPTPHTEMALLFASRAQNLDALILPALLRGAVVLCDRFTDASEAYQGVARGLGRETILGMDALICRGHRPDLTLIFDIDAATSLHRARQRLAQHGSREGRFEQENAAFFDTVRQAYLAIAARDAQRCRLIAAEGSPEAVARAVWEAVSAYLPPG